MGTEFLIGAEFDRSPLSASLDEFHRAQTTHFFQSRPWRAGSGEAFFAATSRDSRLVATSLVRRRSLPVLGKALYSVERGPVAEDLGALREHLAALCSAVAGEAVWLRVSPFAWDDSVGGVEAALREAGFQPFQESEVYDTSIVVDLKPSLEALRASLRRSCKTQLNKAQRADLSVSQDGGELPEFVTRYDAFAQGRGIAPLGDSVIRELQESVLKPESGRLLLARHQGEIVAGILLVPSGNRAIYEWGFASEKPEHRSLPLTYLLHWEGIAWAKQRGFAFYDFGGYWEERGDEDPINRFKTGFSKLKHRFVREHVRRFSPLVASVAENARRILKKRRRPSAQ